MRMSEVLERYCERRSNEVMVRLEDPDLIKVNMIAREIQQRSISDDPILTKTLWEWSQDLEVSVSRLQAMLHKCARTVRELADEVDKA